MGNLTTADSPVKTADLPAKNSGVRGNSVPWHGVPWDIAGRIGLLFSVLCLIKLLMLVGYRKHLYEIHWRIGESPVNWLGQSAFYIFAVLAGLNLWQFGKKCGVGGAQLVRVANFCVLGLGAFFIFLTFHAGDNSYLKVLLDGTLNWWNLKAYLSLMLFFQKPFLAVWLALYGAIYYVLARTGREHLMLQVTAVFAFCYLSLNLGELAVYRNELLVADCFGVACLAGQSASRKALGWIFLVQPWLGIIFVFALFGVEDSQIRSLNPDCALLIAWCLILFAGIHVLAWRRRFYAAWSWLLPFAFCAFLLLTNIHYPLADNYQNLFFLGLVLPHYFIGEACLAFVLLCMAKLYRHWLPRASLIWLDVLSLTLITLALADLRLSQIMGIRLDWQAIAFGANMEMVWREAKAYFIGLAIVAGLTVALYAILIGFWQRGPRAKSFDSGWGGVCFLAAFILLGATGSWLAPGDKARGESAWLLAASSPLVKWASNPPMDKKTFMESARQLGMEQMFQLAEPPTRPARRMNVVIIFQESTYNKYLSLFDGKVDTQPRLAKYRDRMELFPNFFSNYAASINARFAAFTGLYPVRNYEAFTLHRVYVHSLFGILSRAGYHTSLFYSSFLDYTGFRDFLNGRHVDETYDCDSMPGAGNAPLLAWGLHEEVTTRAVCAQIREYATNHQTFFLTYVPVAPHNPFDGVPASFKKFSRQHMGDYTPAYLNELLYLDSCITSIIDQLKSSGELDNTIVVITDDHGEMLGENGGPIGHGWVATPEMTNIPLIIMDPDNPGYHVNYTIGSQIDLLPTLLELLGLPVPPDKIYQGVSLYSPLARTSRTIYLNSIQQYAVLQGNHYILGTRETRNGSFSGDSLQTYSINNDGAKTRFHLLDSTDDPVPNIDLFDKFQESFLQNYSTYCQMIRD